MRALIGLAALLLATPTHGAVLSSTANGFEIEHKVTIAAAPAQVFRMAVQPQLWWNDSHTYSGKASNLSLVARPGGCWCEVLPGGGGVEHMRVASIEPGRKLVLAGALGPLLYEATAGVMVMSVAAAEGGSTLTINYRVAGFARGGAERLAPVVDAVIGEQVKRLAARSPGSAR